MGDVRSVGAAGCAAECSQISSRVTVVAVSAIDLAAAGKGPVADRRATGAYDRAAQTWNFSRGEITCPRHRMKRTAESELGPGIESIQIARIILSLRVSSESNSSRAFVQRLWLVGAVTMAFETDLVLVDCLRQKCVAGGLSFYSCQRAAHQWWLCRGSGIHV